MALISLGGEPVNTLGDLPAVGREAPDFTMTKVDLTETHLGEYAGRVLVLNIFPSIDTPTCAQSVRQFNTEAVKRQGVTVLCVAADLPFAMARFCGAEGLESVMPASVFRNPEFGEAYGVRIVTGPLTGLLSRAVVVIDGHGQVVYTEQVPDIKDAPDIGGAMDAIDRLL